jgi:preprotein translocase subunit SecA
MLSFVTNLEQRRNRRIVARINAAEAALHTLTDAELRSASLALRYRARSGETPRKLAPDAFALVREAARRAVGMRHFDVQLLGGLALVSRGLAEMQTGEGKTLTATLPMYLFALYGKGAHLATVNDYLARRDLQLMQPVYAALGLTTGVVESGTEPPERRKAYAADITYGTGKEFGFDYLRDRLLLRGQDDAGSDLVGRLAGEPDPRRGEKPLQRPPFFMLVDEADSVLIDDAGTPLIIAGAAGEVPAATGGRYEFAAAQAAIFREDEHYELKRSEQRVELTFDGRELVRSLQFPAVLSGVGLVTLYEDVERAILVERLYARDRNYVVRPSEQKHESSIQIVDEFTGRIAEGRKWRSGLHQAIEAKESMPITDDGGQAARITVQEFFLRYKHLAGMSGTAAGSAGELRRIYNLRTRQIPTNRPPIRKRLPTRIFGTAEARWRAVVVEVQTLHAAGRPVLVGTRSIEQSERLSKMLAAAGLEHDVLNAHHETREAEIIARAGERGRITVATNMAGRGTDIRLGEGVHALGGLHVVITEMHEAARIDRQLVGRSGRQGDPGSFRYLLSLEDDLLLEAFGPKRAARLKQLGMSRGDEFPASYERLFRRAQRKVERRRFRRRKQLLAFEKHRNRSALPLGLDPHLDLPG